VTDEELDALLTDAYEVVWDVAAEWGNSETGRHAAAIMGRIDAWRAAHGMSDLRVS
jgi:hypothetical protein